MTRNLGGSIGIALLSALLTVPERLHSNRPGELVSDCNPLTDQLTSLTKKFSASRSDPYSARPQAIVTLDSRVRREATLMPFSDCFYVLAIALFLAIGAAVFSRPAKAAGLSAAH